MDHPQIFAHAFNTPLMVEPRKAQAFVAGFGQRLLGQTPAIVGGVAQVPDAAYRTAKPFASLLDRTLTESIQQGERRGYALRGGVAVVPVTGVLVHRGAWIGRSSGQTSYEGLAAVLEAAAEDPQVGAIALEIDSFGGEVAGCFDLARQIRDLGSRMPVRAFVAEHAYSAAYAIASQADQVVVPATGGVGSIGVICMHADYSRALDAGGITVTIVAAGAHKAEGNPYQPLPEDVRDRLAAEMEALRAMFAATVGAGRGDRLTQAAALATEAASFMGVEAVAAGLADETAAPRAGFDAFVMEINGDLFGGFDRRNMRTSSERSTAMSNQTEGQVDQDQVDDEDQPVEDGAEAEDPASTGAGASTDPKSDERTRIRSIVNAPEAAGHEELAKHLAFSTDMPVQAAQAVLGAAAKDGGSGAGSLASHMSGDDTEIDTPAAEGSGKYRLADAVKKRCGS